MKKLIFKNIFTDVIYFFLITSLSLTLVVWVIQAVNLLDLVSEDGHGFKLYFLYTLLILPKIFTKLIIFLFFLSTFYVLNKYEENNEILIFWTFGVNKLEFINKFIFFACFFVLLQLLFNFYVVPKTLLEARMLFKQSDFSYFPSLIKSKHFNDNTKNLTIYIEGKDPKGNFRNIFVKEKFDANNSQIISSKTGKIIEKNKKSFLILNNGNIINLEKDKTTNIKFDKFELNLSNHKSKTVTQIKIQELNSYDLLKCITSYYFIYTESNGLDIRRDKTFDSNIVNCSGNSFQQIKKEAAQRLFGPIYILIIGLISSSLILKSKNNQIYNKYKTFIFLSGIIIIILSEIISEYVGISLFHLIINISLPILLSIIVYLTILLFLKFNKQSQ